MIQLVREIGAPNIVGRDLVQPGDVAPDFTLPALHVHGTVSLSDYRGRSGVLLAIERGLFCPFCRRHIAQLGETRRKLAAFDVDVLVVVGTPPARARTYLAARPVRVSLAADPMHTVHAAYGLPRFAATPELEARTAATLIDPFDELPTLRPMRELAELMSRDDPYEWTADDQVAYDVGQIQTTGQILIDRDGIVRWVNVEGARDGLAGLGRFPSEKELLLAARAA